MKTFQKIALFIFIALSFQSCIPRYVNRRTGDPIYGPQSFGRQGGQMGPGGRSLTPYYPGQRPDGKMVTGQKKVQTGTEKKEIAYFEATVWLEAGEQQDDLYRTKVQKASDWAASYYEKQHTEPTNEMVSEGVGYQCQIRRVR